MWDIASPISLVPHNSNDIWDLICSMNYRFQKVANFVYPFWRLFHGVRFHKFIWEMNIISRVGICLLLPLVSWGFPDYESRWFDFALLKLFWFFNEWQKWEFCIGHEYDNGINSSLSPTLFLDRNILSACNLSIYWELLSAIENLIAYIYIIIIRMVKYEKFLRPLSKLFDKTEFSACIY